ncbi:hypothetical protein [Streptomyces sp. 769]|uniref:hypothetical protein n=1 Tax=Streptomyces sp. 769 TaxID=1262452 RepID=UPI00131D0287|nr:hypothetical protein [Streptomyces sp. 769]
MSKIDSISEAREEGFYEVGDKFFWSHPVTYPDGRSEVFTHEFPSGTTFDEATGLLTVPTEDGQTETIDVSTPYSA